MSVAEATRGAPAEDERGAPAEDERSLSGWGRTRSSRCRVLRPRATQDVLEALDRAARTGAGAIARGAGRSYGDAAQNGGGDVLDMTGLDRIVSIDPARGLVTAQAGATIAQLMARLAAHGLTLPVVPGTRHVTLAGAIASDIHGKNHHRDGAFARHVASLSLCTPARGLLEVSPASDGGLFYATLGGMGLTGVVVEATLRAEPLQSPWVAADVDRTDGLEQTLELMAGEERHRYSVAWLDLLADGAKLGRAIVSRADPLGRGALKLPARGRRAGGRDYPGALGKRPPVEVPDGFPAALLRPGSVRAFNALRWRASPRRERGRPLALAPYFFPLDALAGWNRLYGAGGLIQYQFAIPAGAETTLVRCFELMRARRLPVYLAVFKRLGAEFGGPLSFPLQGWTLAVDLPAAAPGLGAALQELDELVAGCGGRVYLTKDARMRADTLRAMYPRLERFEAERARADPDGVLRSDLAQRLELCGEGR
jgi:decaprenylphospho-beta-D-ribofuranose 2-oxidase